MKLGRLRWTRPATAGNARRLRQTGPNGSPSRSSALQILVSLAASAQVAMNGGRPRPRVVGFAAILTMGCTLVGLIVAGGIIGARRDA